LIGYQISCGSPKSCFVVGTNFNTSTGNTVPLALAWNGATWKSVAIHAPKGTRFEAMHGVSCKTASYCLAIGSDAGSGGSGPERSFALVWNGRAVRSAPVPPGPAGALQTLLNGVSCVAVNSCVAAGTTAGNGGVSKLLIETWNGAKWTMHALAGGNGISSVSALSVSCVSQSRCALAGDELGLTTGTPRPYLASWNGKTATAMKVPLPSGAKSPLMLAVSCTSASDCAATGASINFGSTITTTAFTESWNGKAWTAHKFAWPAADPNSLLSGISCARSTAAGTRCIAVGGAGPQGHSHPVAMSWNGKAWSVLTVPALGAGARGALEGVSCLTAKWCTAIGQAGPPSSVNGIPLAGFWNGSVWRLTAA
jgi:hypothetical protein